MQNVKQMQIDSTGQFVSYLPSNVIKRLWAVMSVKFPTTWESAYNLSPFDPKGNLTPVACEWSTQLASLSNEEIKTGLDALQFRNEKRFPPNAMEFRDLCVGNEFDTVLEQIITRLQVGESYRFTDKLAFNVWMSVSYDALKAKTNDVPAMCKRVISMIDRNSLFDLPDYSIKQITKPVETKESKEQRRNFASFIFFVIETMATEKQKDQFYKINDIGNTK